MTDRCEPPLALRGVNGWHWLALNYNPNECWEWRTAINGWGRGGQASSPLQMASYGHSYLSPVLTPAEVAALRQRAENRDNPECDGTDAAHPAWWRGADDAYAAICAQLTGILEGAPPGGVRAEPWETVRQRVAALREERDALRLAIQGGEDAPGHASSIPLETILENVRKLHADAVEGWTAATLRAENARLREAIALAGIWHEEQAKALSKQPSGGDRDWRRMQHKEQSEALCAALGDTP